MAQTETLIPSNSARDGLDPLGLHDMEEEVKMPNKVLLGDDDDIIYPFKSKENLTKEQRRAMKLKNDQSAKDLLDKKAKEMFGTDEIDNELRKKYAQKVFMDTSMRKLMQSGFTFGAEEELLGCEFDEYGKRMRWKFVQDSDDDVAPNCCVGTKEPSKKSIIRKDIQNLEAFERLLF